MEQYDNNHKLMGEFLDDFQKYKEPLDLDFIKYLDLIKPYQHQDKQKNGINNKKTLTQFKIWKNLEK